MQCVPTAQAEMYRARLKCNHHRTRYALLMSGSNFGSPPGAAGARGERKEHRRRVEGMSNFLCNLNT